MIKNFFKTGALALLILSASCAKEDSSSVKDELAQEAEAKEKEPLIVSLVEDNVNINGSEKITGTPPTPNEEITLDVSGTSKNALLTEGFDISLDSNADVVGAYIQLKANDGTVADSYYDVNIADNYFSDKSRKSGKRNKNTKGKKAKLTAKDSDVTIDVDFGSKIEPGTFCYVICVYDAEGNISAPSEVCVTVESWGGNSDIVATWNYEKSVDTYEGVSETEVVGVKDCYDYDEYCSLTEMYVTVEECETIDSIKLILNADGTYELETLGTDDILDDEAFVENCEAEYTSYDYSYKAEGNWAYVADSKKLTIVEYTYTEEYEGEIYEETVAAGDGYLVFDGVVDLDGNSLIIEEDYGNGETYVTYLKK